MKTRVRLLKSGYFVAEYRTIVLFIWQSCESNFAIDFVIDEKYTYEEDAIRACEKYCRLYKQRKIKEEKDSKNYKQYKIKYINCEEV